MSMSLLIPAFRATLGFIAGFRNTQLGAPVVTLCAVGGHHI
jgi:hypothetical protein